MKKGYIIGGLLAAGITAGLFYATFMKKPSTGSGSGSGGSGSGGSGSPPPLSMPPTGQQEGTLAVGSGYIANGWIYVYGSGFLSGNTGELLANGTALSEPGANLPILGSGYTSYEGYAGYATLNMLTNNGQNPLYVQMYDTTSNLYSNSILIPYGSVK